MVLFVGPDGIRGAAISAPVLRSDGYVLHTRTMGRLGAFEELVLLAVTRRSGAGYGVTIRADLESETDETISLGAVYATLDRLERKGLVRSSISAPVRERGGRARRLYKVTAPGQAALRAARRVRERLGRTIEARA
jgi:PadR family transcriptional regulator PadR